MAPTYQRGPGFEELASLQGTLPVEEPDRSHCYEQTQQLWLTIQAASGQSVSNQKYWELEGVFMSGFSKRQRNRILGVRVEFGVGVGTSSRGNYQLVAGERSQEQVQAVRESDSVVALASSERGQQGAMLGPSLQEGPKDGVADPESEDRVPRCSGSHRDGKRGGLILRENHLSEFYTRT